jgi:hypothetical protein
MKNFLRLALLALLACFCCTASAQMFKCSKGDGTYNYQPTPCDPGVNGQLLDRKGHVAKPQASAPAPTQANTEVGVTSPDKPLVKRQDAPALAPVPATQTANTPAQSAVSEGVAAGAASFSFIATLVVMVLMFMLFLLPLKMAAVLLKTGKTGWWACLVSGFACMALSLVCFAVLPNNGLRFISILVSALAFVVFLQTNYWRGLILGAVAFVFYVYIPEFVVKKYEHQRALKAQQEQANAVIPASQAATMPAKAA